MFLDNDAESTYEIFKNLGYVENILKKNRQASKIKVSEDRKIRFFRFMCFSYCNEDPFHKAFLPFTEKEKEMYLKKEKARIEKSDVMKE